MKSFGLPVCIRTSTQVLQINLGFTISYPLESPSLPQPTLDATGFSSVSGGIFLLRKLLLLRNFLMDLLFTSSNVPNSGIGFINIAEET